MPPTLACQSVGCLRPLYAACVRNLAAVACNTLFIVRALWDSRANNRVPKFAVLRAGTVFGRSRPWPRLGKGGRWKPGKSCTQSSCEPSGCPARSWVRFTSRPRPSRDKRTRLSVAALACLFGLSLRPNIPGRNQTCVSWSSRACFRFATPPQQPQQRRFGSQLLRLCGSAHPVQQPRTKACVTCGYGACPCTLSARVVARRAWRFWTLSPRRCGTLLTRHTGWASSTRANPANL